MASGYAATVYYFHDQILQVAHKMTETLPRWILSSPLTKNDTI